MKYIEDGRSLVERNHDAREYCYQCRREREERMNRIVRRCLVVSSMIFMCSLLVGWAL
jgi:cell division septal protein FtsQ